VEEVNATDLDTGENAEIVYQIQHGSFNDFAIDNRTGIITIAKPLDYDVRSNYTLEIIAYDKGVPSLSGTATIEINIINSNDKAPYFVPTTQRSEVGKDAEIDSFVHQLTATDPDIGSVDLLEYTLDETQTTAVSEDGQEIPAAHMFSEYFAINKSGAVTVNKKLRRDLFAVSLLNTHLSYFSHFQCQLLVNFFLLHFSSSFFCPNNFLL
jgi:Cadherin domain